MGLANVRQIAEYVVGTIQIPSEMAREAGDHIPQLLAELADDSILVEALLGQASETDDPLVKEILEGTAIGLTTRANHLLMKMEVAEAFSLHQQESANARRQETWGGIPFSDELLLELAAKLPPHIQRSLVDSWIKKVGV